MVRFRYLPPSKKMSKRFNILPVLVPSGFDVKCDETNNTQQDIDERRINVSIILHYSILLKILPEDS